MSNIVWDEDNGWHDGAEATVSLDDAGRIVTTDEARLAAGQLQGILSQLRREGLLSSVALYESTLDVHSASDRRTIASLYAHMAREAMGR